MMRIKMVLVAAYALVGVATFGHCAGQIYRQDQAEYAACRAKPDAVCFRTPELAPVSGVVAGVFWPLYWSWEAWL